MTPHGTVRSKRPNPYCPVCHGLGWYQAPHYGDFEPRMEAWPCPDCNPVDPISRVGCALVVAIFAMLIAFLAWGAGQ